MREGKGRIIYDNYDIEEQYRDVILEDLEEGESLTEQEIWDRMSVSYTHLTLPTTERV